MYQKVLVPLDGSELAEYALDHVKKLAKDGFLGETVLLKVCMIKPPVSYADSYPSAIGIAALMNDYIDKSKKYLRALQSKLSVWRVADLLLSSLNMPSKTVWISSSWQHMVT